MYYKKPRGSNSRWKRKQKRKSARVRQIRIRSRDSVARADPSSAFYGHTGSWFNRAVKKRATLCLFARWPVISDSGCRFEWHAAFLCIETVSPHVPSNPIGAPVFHFIINLSSTFDLQMGSLSSASLLPYIYLFIAVIFFAWILVKRERCLFVSLNNNVAVDNHHSTSLFHLVTCVPNSISRVCLKRK